MTKIASIHSFGGITDTSLTANLLVSIARSGYRVGVLDTGDQVPTIHACFGLNSAVTDHAWNEYIWSDQATGSLLENGHSRPGGPLAQLSRVVNQAPPILSEGAGEVAVMGRGVFLLPFEVRADDLSRVLREGHDVEPLKDGVHTLVNRLNLDFLLINTHPGTTEEIVFSIALSHILVVILRPDQIEYQATAVTVEVGRQLHVPKILLVVDNLPTGFDLRNVHEQVEHTFNTVVAGILPSDETVAAAATKGIFYREYPNHPWSQELASIARQIIT